MIRITAAVGLRICHLIGEGCISPECITQGDTLQLRKVWMRTLWAKGQVTGTYVLTISRYFDTLQTYHPAANLLPREAPPVKIFSSLLAAALLIGCGGGGGGGGGTSAVAPTATTNGASSITLSAATLNGSVNPNGTETSAWFEWSTNPNLQNSTATLKKSVGAGTSLQPVSEMITGLVQGVTYYYRVVAQSAGGITQGSIVSFSTTQLFSPPSVSTHPPTLVTGTGAQLNGNAIPNGLATVAWFEWGTSPTLATYTPTAEQYVGDGLVSVAVNDNLIGLATGQTYAFRIAARNSSGTTRGNIAGFTAGTSPSVTTQSATSILDTSAIVNGSGNTNGLATNVWFEYSTNSSLTPHDSTTPKLFDATTGNFTISTPVAGLSPVTTYYFRVVAQNSAGGQSGLIVNFTTVAVPPPGSLWDQMVWDQDNWQ